MYSLQTRVDFVFFAFDVLLYSCFLFRLLYILIYLISVIVTSAATPPTSNLSYMEVESKSKQTSSAT